MKKMKTKIWKMAMTRGKRFSGFGVMKLQNGCGLRSAGIAVKQ